VISAFAIFEAEAARAMGAAGVGAELTLPLGGKRDMPAIGLKGEPRTLVESVSGSRVRAGPWRRA
jgi:microcystin degradation protein MlrC